jgi:hypothetical protein
MDSRLRGNDRKKLDKKKGKITLEEQVSITSESSTLRFFIF